MFNTSLPTIPEDIGVESVQQIVTQRLIEITSNITSR